MADESMLKSCDACGATVYPEHVDNGLAGEREGNLLCRHCLEAYEEEHGGRSSSGMDTMKIPLPGDDDSVSLDDSDDGARPSRAIKAFGSSPTGMSDSIVGQVVQKTDYRRPLLKGSPSATRCRTFHCKLTDASMGHLNELINEWVDGEDDIEIKFATSAIGVVEGKHADPHLIVTVFY